MAKKLVDMSAFFEEADGTRPTTIPRLHPVTGQKIGEDAAEPMAVTMGRLLINSKEGDSLKMFGLAKELTRHGKVEVDEADFQTLKDAVMKSEAANHLIKANLLYALNDAKEVKPPESDESSA